MNILFSLYFSIFYFLEFSIIFHETALHFAAKKHSIEIANLLLSSKRIDINAPSVLNNLYSKNFNH